jgi:hypothetical protein
LESEDILMADWEKGSEMLKVREEKAEKTEKYSLRGI